MASGAFRPVHVAFVANVLSATMVRIQQREVAATTGLDDAAAYTELATLMVRSLGCPNPETDHGKSMLIPSPFAAARW